MKAQDFLRKGADLLEERGKQYDQPGGERSMGKAVKAFNAITGRGLTEPEGWLLLQVLKDVRQWQNPDKYHADSAEDCVSYAALKAEALAESSKAERIESVDPVHYEPFLFDPITGRNGLLPVAADSAEPAAAMQDDSERMAVIGQNGNGGEHYHSAEKPSWACANEAATHLLFRPVTGVYEFGFYRRGEMLDSNEMEFCLDTQDGWVIIEARPSKDATQ